MNAFPIDGDIAAALGAFVGSLALTALVRRRALLTARLDHPNERSSHSVPTPRGGGVGPVVSWLCVGAARAAFDHDGRLAAVLLAVALVAAIGWADDRWSLPVAPRLIGHLVAGVVAGLGIGGGSAVVVLACALSVAAGVNLVNFMDGIDGLVSSEVVIFGATLWALSAGGGVVQLLAAALVGAGTGFLVWNWPPARIFLGDVGSGSFGAITVLLLWLAGAGAAALAGRAALPLVPLFVDATATLARRFFTGEPVWRPHRTHLYQELANGPWGHARTTVVFCALGVLGSAIGIGLTGTPLAPAATAFVVLCFALWGGGLVYVRRRRRVVRGGARKYV